MYGSVIIPAYNEAQRLPKTLCRYLSYLHTAHVARQCEVIVVANGCHDATVDCTRSFQHGYPLLRVIDIPAAIGKGGAVLAGWQQAQGQRVAFVDADGATPPETLAALFDRLDSYDMTIGSRRLPTSVIHQQQPALRRASGWLFGRVVQGLFGLPFADTQCGAKALRADALRRLLPLVQEQHWAFDVDLLLCARALDFSVSEVPVAWSDVSGSKLRMGRTAWEVLVSLYRLKKRHAQPLQPVYSSYS